MKPDPEDQTLFADQLRAYREQADPEKRSTVEAAIWERFGEEGAVFVLDMSGFSRLSEKHGLILYLSRIHRMQGCVRPLIEDHGGQVVKYLADNAFALFPQVEQAIETAIDINRLLNEENEKTQEAFDIEVSCGIAFGKVLLLPGFDYFGTAVNRACKLGEDLASAGEIFVTAKAMDRVPGTPYQTEPFTTTLSGIYLPAHKIVYS